MDGQTQVPNHGRAVPALSLQSFALRVVSELARSGGRAQENLDHGLVHRLVGYARSGDQGYLSVLYADLKQRRITSDDIVDRYLPQAVNIIGHQWHEEEIDILQASMACARMQNMLHEMGDAMPPDRGWRPQDGAVLLTLPKGEQHTLGVLLAASQLRRMGVSVKVLLQPDPPELRYEAMRNPFQAVFVSISNVSSLRPCKDIVDVLREEPGCGVPIVVGGGLVSAGIAGIDAPRIKKLTGADVVTNDIERALHCCNIQQTCAAAE